MLNTFNKFSLSHIFDSAKILEHVDRTLKTVMMTLKRPQAVFIKRTYDIALLHGNAPFSYPNEMTRPQL